jgi:hypothetical protein
MDMRVSGIFYRIRVREAFEIEVLHIFRWMILSFMCNPWERSANPSSLSSL